MPAMFLLGTHQPGWLARAGVPLFISDVRLRVYKTLPRAAVPWALDSSGFSELQYHGRWLHGFGVKTLGLARYGHLLTSADSLAWSYDARREQHPLPGCTRHKNCANCLRYARQWRNRLPLTLAA